MEDSTVEEEEEDLEDDASLLKRASSVHAALFLSLPSSKSSSNADVTITTTIGMELVQELVQSILENSTEERDGNRAWKELITSLSFALAPTNNNNRNGIGKEQWRKICLTNALLAIQYLLHLMPNGGDGSSAHCMADTLNGWNTVILPMLFGTPSSSSLLLLLSTKKEQRSASLLIKNDALRNALLNLRPSASSSTVPSSNNHSTTTTTTSDTTAANLVIEQCKHTCTLCLNALRQITSSSSPNKQLVVLVVLMKRQKTIIVICQVLLRLLEDIAKLSKKKIITQSMAVGGLEEVVDKCMDIGKDAVHRAVLMVLRGVCYDSVVVGNDHGITTSGAIATTTAEMVIQPPLLSLEALRPITGMLLPQLYPPSAPSSSTSSSSKNVKGAGEESPIVDRRVLEIWNEILLLLAPYSTSLIGGDEEMEIGGRKLRCCQNW